MIGMKGNFLFTSESVTEGHPDKICDQISDAILDDLYRQDPDSRVAVETLVKTGSVMLAGEITSKGYANIERIVRDVVRKIGYTKHHGFCPNSIGIWSNINKQSEEIARGVNKTEDKEQGAGDQGIMFGFATKEQLNMKMVNQKEWLP